MAVHLSKRMEALARMVTPGNRLCDVGCDHGFLPIYLVQQKLIPSAIAMDIGEGPLLAAKTHIAEAGLETVITTRRSDGLAQVSEDETDTILIAGMGGGIVIHILTEGRSVARKVKELILQPQSDIPHFRRFLSQIGWKVVEEELILEDGKFYPMMKVVHGEKEHISEGTPYTLEEWFGGLLLKRRHPVLKEYLERELRIRTDIVEKLKNAPAAGKRLGEIEEERQVILTALKIYEGI